MSPAAVSPRTLGAAGALAAGLVALLGLLVHGGGSPQPVPAGLPDPGRVTGWGLPLLGYAGLVLGVLAVGSLLVPALTADRADDRLAGRSVAAVRLVRRLGLTWAVVVLAELVLTLSDQFAVPLGDVRWSELSGFARQVDQGQALLVQAFVALLVGLVSRWVLTVRESGFVLALALVGLLPPVLTGHSAASGSHDTAVVSLLLHVGAAAVWTGGVVALWWHLGPRAAGRTNGSAADEARARAASRFSGLAAWCLVLVVASGVVNALVRLGSPAEVLTTGYGHGVLAKLLVVAAVAVLAARLRRGVLARAGASSDAGRSTTGPLLGLTGVELGLMAVAGGLGVALGRTPPPVGEPYTSAAESLLGGPLPPAPDLWRLLTAYTPSALGLTALGLGGAAYVVGLLALRRRGVPWSVGRTISWFVGIALVAYATMGGLGTYSHVMFSAHMAAHMVLSMVAPIFLVLGAPVTLALRALPGSDVPGGQGPRQWLAAALQSRVSRVVVHPITAAAVSVASLYAVYFTGLYGALMENHLGHTLMEVHFLVSGYLLFEVLVGDAPIPHRVGHFARLGMLLVVMPFHAFFAVVLMGSDGVVAESYYAMLDRPYATDLLQDQYVGASMTWALGEVPMVMVLVVLLAQWARDDRRQAKRQDRHADRTDDAELAAYNAMLARAARSSSPED
ncbi:cytochrome c oxidase assembly protein [Nocardioides sp. IC4_145]|nr:cytochrome c oxidase assembly protein [Nocardioides sp. IC4_145]NHC22764.1 cytochrome c oxidase assembly protein [Nocardioides sp. IC4_145]